jgi:hypothetical protein
MEMHGVFGVIMVFNDYLDHFTSGDDVWVDAGAVNSWIPGIVACRKRCIKGWYPWLNICTVTKKDSVSIRE